MTNLKIKLSIQYLLYKLRKRPSLRFSFRNLKFEMVNSHVDFWKQYEHGNWESETFDILDNYLFKNSIYVDIGGWIGPTVCYAAQRAELVYAYEPDPYAFYILKENVKRNRLGNVRLSNRAVSSSDKSLRMASFGASLGDSQTSSLQGSGGKSFLSRTIDIRNFTIQFTRVDFLKMDIEGGEFDLIPNMSIFFDKHRPVLYISLHSPYLDENIRMQSLEGLFKMLKTYYSIFRNDKMEVITLDEFIYNDAQNFVSLICEK